MKWVEGDTNTGICHWVANNRRKSCSKLLEIEHKDQEMIRCAITYFFKKFYEDWIIDCSFIESLHWCLIDGQRASWLERTFCEELIVLSLIVYNI